MSKFIQPVSMQVTQEQYEKDLKQPLKELGYKEDNITPFSKYDYLITNYSGTNNLITNIDSYSKNKNDRYFIESYNPELFLALAAMTDKIDGIIGEYWKFFRPINTSFTINNLYKQEKLLSQYGAFKDNVKSDNGWCGVNQNYFIKATKEEIIQSLTKTKSIMTNVDRNTSIKCANEEEFNTVVQWLRDNGEEVLSSCFYNNTNYHVYPCIYFYNSGSTILYNGWSSKHFDTNSKTPQELSIITSKTKKVKQTIKKSNLILLHNSYSCATWTSEILTLIQKHPFAFDETLIEIPDALITKAINEANPIQQSSIKKMGIDLVVDKSIYLASYKITDLMQFGFKGDIQLKSNWNWKLDGNVLTAEIK